MAVAAFPLGKRERGFLLGAWPHNVAHHGESTLVRREHARPTAVRQLVWHAPPLSRIFRLFQA